MNFTYDPATGQYRDRRGRVISDAALRRMQADSESKHVIEMLAIAIALVIWQQINRVVTEADVLTPEQVYAIPPEALRAQVAKRARELGPLSPRDYQAKMQEQIALSHTVNTVLATGGFAAMTIAAWNLAETRVRTETAYEVRMAAQLQAGQVSPAQLVNRSAMYSESTYRTFSQAKTNAAKAAGVLEARRILDPRAEHCEDCPELASSEWERIEYVTPIGESQCQSRCRCYIQYRRNTGEKPADTPLPEVPPTAPARVILPPAA
jgi:hypothetical protein